VVKFVAFHKKIGVSAGGGNGEDAKTLFFQLFGAKCTGLQSVTPVSVTQFHGGNEGKIRENTPDFPGYQDWYFVEKRGECRTFPQFPQVFPQAGGDVEVENNSTAGQHNTFRRLSTTFHFFTFSVLAKDFFVVEKMGLDSRFCITGRERVEKS